ncbi:MAG: pyruvate kinase, partial [Nanoarchaeota archaeon]|nr:pyruvate kinase [Nanoarchaeota archaeon]
NQAGKFVITATQMLQSMVSNPTPTRAETSDVANAILDGSDVIMLSGETSIGKYPVLAVKEMTKITRSVQGSVTSRILPESNISTAISHSVAGLCHHLPITRVVALTSGGFTARMISRFRLRQQIIAITPDKTICKALTLYYGIEPMQIPVMPRKKIMKEVAKFLQSRKMIHKNDLILFTGSIYKKESGSTNLIEIHSADEILS